MDAHSETALAVPAPLAWDQSGEPFTPTPATRFWRVKRQDKKSGPPVAVVGPHGHVHLAVDADFAEFRDSVGGKPGRYKLYPCDAHGQRLPDDPIAYIPLATEPHGSDRDNEREDLMRGLVGEFLAHSAKQNELLQGIVTTLVRSSADIQKSTAELVSSVNDALQIANGDRLPEALAELGTDAANSAWAQVLNGPFGIGILTAVKTGAEALAAKAKATPTKDDNS